MTPDVKKIFDKKSYVLDPHGAIGYLGLKKYMSMNKQSTGIFLETAHPIKFSRVLEKKLNTKLVVPEKVTNNGGGTGLIVLNVPLNWIYQ